jgi:hypothetical protein
VNITRWVAAPAIAILTTIGAAWAAGNLTSGATVIKIDMTADKKFSVTSIQMETGKAYTLEITKVAGDEYQFRAPDLFSNSYIQQIAINRKEVHTHVIDWLEFDDPGTMSVTLVPNRVGVFKYWVSRQEETMSGTITVK